MSDQLTSIEQLEAVYGRAVPAAMTKEIDHISIHYAQFINKAPFVVLATSGPGGLDCSPRGDPPGFVRIQDEKTLLIPDRRGNNRIDTLKNLIENPEISLLFLIPGIGETLRVNSCAKIMISPELIESFRMQDKLPRSIVQVNVRSVYFQCQKALVRSGLWRAETQIPRSDLPSTGTMLEHLAKANHQEFNGKSYDSGYSEHMKKTIY